MNEEFEGVSDYLSDEALGTYDDYEFAPPPVPVGMYDGFIEALDGEPEVFNFDDRGPFVSITAHFRIRGGVHDNRRLGFVRLNSVPSRFGQKSSRIIDLLMSARTFGFDMEKPRTAQDLVDAVVRLVDTRATVRFKIDHTAFSIGARDLKLCELTGEDYTETAKSVASREQWDEAKKFATLAKNSKAFPPGETTLVCPHTGALVRAREVVKFFAPNPEAEK